MKKLWGRYPHISWIIWYAILLHLVWAFALVTLGDASSPVGIATLKMVFNYNIAAMIYGGAALMAMTEILRPLLMGTRTKNGIWLLLPQQFLLMLSAGDAVIAAVHGKYADGYQAPGIFILVDQSPAIISAILHTLSIIERVTMPDYPAICSICDRPKRG